MDADSEAELQALFKPNELERLAAFLNRDGGFSFAGELALVTAILELQEYSTLDDILIGCIIEWTSSWSKQSSDVRGDPKADGYIGMRNRIALETLYNRFNIQSSFEGIELHIPSSSFSVTTRWELYEFGAMALTGWRSVTRLDDELPFEQCIVNFFRGEKPMVLYYQDVRTNCFMHTAVVVNYKVDSA